MEPFREFVQSARIRIRDVEPRNSRQELLRFGHGSNLFAHVPESLDGESRHMHGRDILNTAIIKHFRATGVKGLVDRVGTPPVDRRPALSQLTFVQVMGHPQATENLRQRRLAGASR